MSLYSIPTFLGAFLSLILGFFVFLKNKRSEQNISFLSMCLTIFVWLFAYTITYSTKDVTTAIISARIACTAVVFLATTFYHFIVVFLKAEKEKIFVWLSYVISFIFLYIFLFTNYFLAGVHKYYWGYYSKAGSLHPIFLVFFFSLFTRGIFILLKVLRYHQELPSVVRAQIKYVFIGLIVIGFGGIDFIPKYGIEFYPFGFLFILAFISVTAYAIVKYRLMDIRVFISKAVAFLISYPLLLGVPFFFAYRMYPVLYPYLGFHWWTVAFALLAFFATLAPLAYGQLRKGMENALLAEQKKYQRLLLQAAAGMAREHNLRKLAKLIVYILKRTVKISFAAIFLEDKDNKSYKLSVVRDGGRVSRDFSFSSEHPLIDYLKAHREPAFYEELPLAIKSSLNLPLDIQLFISSSIENDLLGFVVLGEKLNRQAYTDDDLNVFTTLSNQAALAISYCLFLQEFKNAQERIFTADKLGLIGGMADGVAHQIKNRLNQFSIAGGALQFGLTDYMEKYSQIIEANPDMKKDLAEFLDTTGSIISNVKKTDGIIKGFLGFARVEEKEKEHYFSEFHCQEITDYALDMLKVKHEVTTFPLEVNLGSDDTIYGVKSQLLETIFNIVDNCYEACDEKKMYRLTGEEKEAYKPKITFKLTQNQNYSLITIADNGVGVKDEDRKRIFAPFFTTKSSFKSGTGIGMYIVKRIVEENHHGHIWFESEYMKGTTFGIKLPRRGKSLL